MNPFRRFLKSPFSLVPAMLVVIAAGCGGGGLDPILGSPGVGMAPTVTATSPLASVPAVTGVVATTLVTATFSKPMAAALITPTSFTLACPSGTPVGAAVSYDATSQTATLTPNTALPGGTTCAATVTTAAQDGTGFALAANFVWNFVTAIPDTTRPTVVLTVPGAGATAVATNTGITATFSEDMAAATVSGTSFTVTNTTLGTPVAGNVSYSVAARTATFTPTTPAVLASNTLFTVTITPVATDLAGNALAGNAAVSPNPGNHVWTFTTGATTDTTRPTVVLTVPAVGATAVVNNTKITATFSENMAPATISGSSFTLVNTTLGSPVVGTVSYSVAARTATFAPTSPAVLPGNTLFTATVTQAATDLAGNALAGTLAALPNASDFVWTFTTSAAVVGDTTPPTVTAITPLDNAIVCSTATVSATFSEAIDAATVNAAIVIVTDNGVGVAGSVSYDATNRIASFVPTSALGFAFGRTFVVSVKSGSAGVKDLAGNPLAVDRVWRFNTAASACPPVITVNLGSAAAFGAFGGGAGVTNQGINTVINGNLASTAACTLMTGLHDAANVYTQTPLNIGAVNGNIYCGPPAPGTTTTLDIAIQARADALAAYSALAAMPPGSDPGAGQLGGLVLPPAVYTAAGGTFAITSGDLTLDAQGDPNALWVFQSASSLTIGLSATPHRVLLINGAQARNVFWQVGSAARIEDGSTMAGTILAPAGVTISTAGQTIQTTLIGRALSLTASVTMVNTTVVAP